MSLLKCRQYTELLNYASGVLCSFDDFIDDDDERSCEKLLSGFIEELDRRRREIKGE
jgi:hypothetical protein